MGTWVLVLAAVTSFVGVFVGVASARKAVTVRGSQHRLSWLAWGALSIGGVGLWLPKVIALVGLEIEGTAIRYDMMLIVFSLLVAVATGFAALYVVSPLPNRHRAPTRSVEFGRLAIGGAILAIGTTVAHLLIVSGVRIQGEVDFDIVMIAASAVVNLLAVVLILWTAQAVDARVVRLGCAFAAGCALVAAHYIGVYGIEPSIDPDVAPPSGTEMFSILFPAFVLGLLVLTIPITALLMAPDRVAAELDLEADALAGEELDREFEAR